MHGAILGRGHGGAPVTPVYVVMVCNACNLGLVLWGRSRGRDVVLASMSLGFVALLIMMIWARWLLWL